MRKILIKIIDLYQKTPYHKSHNACRFYPTCSEYGRISIQKHGSIKGSYFTLKRILRCHPWNTPKIDLPK